jgi:hypothetical protein
VSAYAERGGERGDRYPVPLRHGLQPIEIAGVGGSEPGKLGFGFLAESLRHINHLGVVRIQALGQHV